MANTAMETVVMLDASKVGRVLKLSGRQGLEAMLLQADKFFWVGDLHELKSSVTEVDFEYLETWVQIQESKGTLVTTTLVTDAEKDIYDPEGKRHTSKGGNEEWDMLTRKFAAENKGKYHFTLISDDKDMHKLFDDFAGGGNSSKYAFRKAMINLTYDPNVDLSPEQFDAIKTANYGSVSGLKQGMLKFPDTYDDAVDAKANVRVLTELGSHDTIKILRDMAGDFDSKGSTLINVASVGLMGTTVAVLAYKSGLTPTEVMKTLGIDRETFLVELAKGAAEDAAVSAVAAAMTAWSGPGAIGVSAAAQAIRQGYKLYQNAEDAVGLARMTVALLEELDDVDVSDAFGGGLKAELVEMVLEDPGILAFLVSGNFLAAGFKAGLNQVLEKLGMEQCFPEGTPITLWDGSRKAIEEIGTSDVVLSFDEAGNAVPGRIDKLFRNTTQEFVRLTFDDRDDLVATPGHRFRTETGDYMEIGHMLRLGGGHVRVVDVSGEIVEARGEVIAYSAETAHLFAESQSKTIAFSGNTILKEDAEQGWQTYNFEVREHHNYVADGIRVHNDSILSYMSAVEIQNITRLDVDEHGVPTFALVKIPKSNTEIQKTLVTNPDGTRKVIAETTTTDGNGNLIYWREERDSEGNPILEDRNGDGVIDRDDLEVVYLSGQQVGASALGALTPFMTQAFLGDDPNVFAEIAVDTVMGTVLENLGETLGGVIHRSIIDIGEMDLGTQINTALEVTFEDFGGELILNGVDTVLSTVNQLIMTEIFEVANIEGVPGAVFEAVVSNGLDTILTHGADWLLKTEFMTGVFEAIGVAETIATFEPTQFMANPISLIFTAVINEVLPDFETTEGAIASAISSVVASGAIAIFNLLGSASSALAGPIGALVGFVIGGIFESLFGRDTPVPKALTSVFFNETTGYFEIGDTSSQDGGNVELSIAMAQGYVDGMNNIVDSLMATYHNYGNLGNWTFGHHLNKLTNNGKYSRTFSDAQDAFLDAYVRDTASAYVRDGQRVAVDALKDLNVRSLKNAQRDYSQENTSASPDEMILSAFYAIDAGQDFRHSAYYGITFNSDGSLDFSENALAFLSTLQDNLILNDKIYTSNPYHSTGYYTGINALISYIQDIFGSNEIANMYDFVNIFKNTIILLEYDIDKLHVFKKSDYYRGILDKNVSYCILDQSDITPKIYTNLEIYQLITTRLQLAQDYHTYLENKEAIEAIIFSAPNSALAAGWVATIAQAEEMGFNDPHHAYGDYKDNTFYTADGRDTVSGLGGNDFIKTYGGGDSVWGGDGDDYINGGSGKDNLRGDAGNDTIIGGAGNDRIVGGDGNDYLDGGEGDDNLYGGSGNDHVKGGEGHNILEGGEGDDILEAGSGRNFIYGGDGEDTAIFANSIREVEHAYRTLEYWNGLTSVYSNGLTSVYSNGLYVSLRVGGHRTEIRDVESFQFSDWEGDYAALHNTFYYISEGNKEISPTSGDSPLLILKDLTIADVTFSILENDLIISWTKEKVPWGTRWLGASGELRIADMGSHIERFEFADGSVVGRIALDAAGQVRLYGTGGDDLIVGGSGADRIFGNSGDDILDAGGHDGSWQYLYGRSGDDTYRYGSEAGRVFISGASEGADNGTDTVVFKDLALSDVSFSTADYTRGGTLDHREGVALNINWSKDGQSGQLRIGQLGSHIERFEFADGSVVGRIALDAAGQVRLYGTGGDDLIVGGSGADRIFGGSGDDILQAGAHAGTRQYLYGQAGDDTYLYSQDNGHMWISRHGESEGTGTDTFRFTDLTLEDLTFSSYTHGTQGEVLLARWSDADGQSYRVDFADMGSHIERFEFADGSVVGRIALDAAGQVRLYGTGGDDLIVGGSGADRIFGNSGDDRIAGGAGTDTLYGNTGNDVLLGGAGADVLDGGSGTDRAQYSDSATGVTVSLEDSALNTGIAAGDTYVSIENLLGSRHNDSLHGDKGANTIWGGAGTDTIEGGAGTDILYGNSGDDRIAGGAGTDTLYGNTGNDVLLGGAGADVLDGGSGTDRAQYSDSATGVTVSLEDSALNTGIAAGDTYVSIENLYGSRHNDSLHGDEGANTIWGWHGDDWLSGKGGKDHLDGGAGVDWAGYGYSAAAVVVNLAAGTMTGAVGDTDTLVNIENVSGSAFGDSLWGDERNNILLGNTGNDVLLGGAGADVLDGGSGTDRAQYSDSATGVTVSLEDSALNTGIAAGDTYVSIENLYGSRHNDSLHGDEGVNSIWGWHGDDWLSGKGGKDHLDGGAGVDWAGYGYSAAAVVVDLEYGEACGASGDVDTLVNIENVSGSAFGDSLWGDERNNILLGGAGDDYLEGGDGDDVLEGGAGDDYLEGGDGDDVLEGGAGDDYLWGEEGNNTLRGGDGNDSLSGGGGADTFVFEAQVYGSDSPLAATPLPVDLRPTDFIYDYEDGVDKIGIDLSIFGTEFEGTPEKEAILSIHQEDADTHITLSGTYNVIILWRQDSSQITEDDFVFV